MFDGLELLDAGHFVQRQDPAILLGQLVVPRRAARVTISSGGTKLLHHGTVLHRLIVSHIVGEPLGVFTVFLSSQHL